MHLGTFYSLEPVIASICLAKHLQMGTFTIVCVPAGGQPGHQSAECCQDADEHGLHSGGQPALPSFAGACLAQLKTYCMHFKLTGYSNSCAWAVQVLVEKARVEAEDAQRILLSALNGLAGLMLIEDDKTQAVALYRQVLTNASYSAHVLEFLASPTFCLPITQRSVNILEVYSKINGDEKQSSGCGMTMIGMGMHAKAELCARALRCWRRPRATRR